MISTTRINHKILFIRKSAEGNTNIRRCIENQRQAAVNHDPFEQPNRHVPIHWANGRHSRKNNYEREISKRNCEFPKFVPDTYARRRHEWATRSVLDDELEEKCIPEWCMLGRRWSSDQWIISRVLGENTDQLSAEISVETIGPSARNSSPSFLSIKRTLKDALLRISDE